MNSQSAENIFFNTASKTNTTSHSPITLAFCNFLDDNEALKSLGIEYGFGGIDWSFDPSSLPETPEAESLWIERIKELFPLEVRYHCPFPQMDIGHENPLEQQRATDVFLRIIRLISKAGGKYLTIHVGLGHDTTRMLSWEHTVTRLKALVRFGEKHGVRLCLENLAWGWTSKPNLFEKLIRLSGAGVTLDIGHAHACEAVKTQQYACEDFVEPHMEIVHNAHIYHDERDGIGHVPPENVSDIEGRLDILMQTNCRWWTLEIRETDGLKQTKQVIDRYFERMNEALCRRHKMFSPSSFF